MATVAAGTIKTSVKGSLSDSSLDIGQASYSFDDNFTVALVNGAGAGAITQVWADIRTIAASSNDDINLTSLTNALGGAVNFSAIKAMAIKANANNTNNLIIGDAATPFASFFGDAEDTIIIPPGGMINLVNPSATGYVVTPSTNHLLRVTNGGAGSTVNYQIYLYGVTA